jgi:hypothetical protein
MNFALPCVSHHAFSGCNVDNFELRLCTIPCPDSFRGCFVVGALPREVKFGPPRPAAPTKYRRSGDDRGGSKIAGACCCARRNIRRRHERESWHKDTQRRARHGLTETTRHGFRCVSVSPFAWGWMVKSIDEHVAASRGKFAGEHSAFIIQRTNRRRHRR